MTESNPNRYILLVFSADNQDKALLTLNSTTPFGAIALGDSITVNDLRSDDTRESRCASSGGYSKVTYVEHRISQCSFGEMEHLTKIVVSNNSDDFIS